MMDSVEKRKLIGAAEVEVPASSDTNFLFLEKRLLSVTAFSRRIILHVNPNFNP